MMILIPSKKSTPRVFSLIFTGIMLFLIGFLILKISPAPESNIDIINCHRFELPRVAGSVPSIFINGINSSQDWNDCPWVNGSGTYSDPYVIANLTIDSGASGRCIYIANTREYLRVINCTIVNLETQYTTSGIYIYNVTNVLIQNNTCIGGFCGIYFIISRNCTVDKNTCTGCYNGIYISTSDNCTLTRNFCKENYLDGIKLSSSSDNTLTENTCTGNNANGIVLSSSNNCNLTMNNCVRNCYGILLSSSNNNIVSRCNSSGNVYNGIGLSSSNENILSGSICLSNYDNGIKLYLSYNNLLTESTCMGGSNGIYLQVSDNNSLAGNNCTINSYGIILSDSRTTTVIGNNCTINSYGIILSDSRTTTVIGNNCTGNYYGIYLFQSDNNMLTNNYCIGDYYGITLRFSRMNVLTENNCTGNSNGIYLFYSSTNVLVSNNCTGNIWYGFLSFFSGNNEFSLNIAKYNGINSFYQINTESYINNNVHHNFFAYKPRVSFTVSWGIIANIPVQFQDTTSDGDLPFTYQWNFGDGAENSTLQNPTHIFLKPGLYRVILCVTDFDNDVSVYQIEILVLSIWIYIIISCVIAGIVVVVRKSKPMRILQQLAPQIEYTILALAPQCSSLQVEEIGEICEVSDDSLIINILRKLIKRKQIDATYFKSTQTIAFQNHFIKKSFAQDRPAETRQSLDLKLQNEYARGKVRITISVKNVGKVKFLRVICALNIPDTFNLLRIEPLNSPRNKSILNLKSLLPEEEKVVAYVIEPMICGKEHFSVTVSGIDGEGHLITRSINPLEVEIQSPSFNYPEETNLTVLYRMMADLPVKCERVFYLPHTFSPSNAFEVVTSVISERNVRLVGTIIPVTPSNEGPLNQSAWFYGTTRVYKKRFIIIAGVSETRRIIRVSTVSDDEAGCAGLLAEVVASIRKELVRRGAYETEKDVVELVCEKCGANLLSAPTINIDTKCPDCHRTWRARDFFH